MQDLVLSHMALADRLAQKKKNGLPRRIDIDELKSAAYLGLVEAAGRFDVSKGATFTTFAYFRIMGAMNDYLRELGLMSVSLDDQADDEGCLKDTIPAPADDCLAFDEVIEVVAEGLGDQAKQVLKLYYGEDLTMREVGSAFGVGESRVSQLLTSYKQNIRSRWTRGDLGAELAA